MTRERSGGPSGAKEKNSSNRMSLHLQGLVIRYGKEEIPIGWGNNKARQIITSSQFELVSL
jgi:hypothetical protein